MDDEEAWLDDARVISWFGSGWAPRRSFSPAAVRLNAAERLEETRARLPNRSRVAS
jgi:hypothetical protein